MLAVSIDFSGKHNQTDWEITVGWEVIVDVVSELPGKWESVLWGVGAITCFKDGGSFLFHR
jgi:hypothetical protein